MKYGYCFLSVVPIRKEPRSASEQVSQLLFGDFVEILDELNNDTNPLSNSSNKGLWYKIRNVYDNYEGWIDSNCVFQVQKQEIRPHKYLVSKNSVTISIDSHIVLIPFASKIIDDSFIMGKHSFNIMQKSGICPIVPYNKTIFKNLISTCLNAPYQWGGKSIFGMDCSGFTQNIFSFFGVNLPRDAKDQAKFGKEISFKEIKTGDLVFFDNEKRAITHVGICNGKGMVVHCSAFVHESKLTEKGLTKKYQPNILTHHFCKAIRVINI